MRNAIKNTAFSILFISILIGLLTFFSLLLSPKNNNNEGGIIDPAANGILSEPENTIDVLIVGDSESYSAFIPLQIWEQHGITSYCCGTSGQLLSYSEQFVHKAFREQTPKIVILETNAIFRKVSFDKALENKMGAYFSVFTYHNRWKTMRKSDLNLSVSYNYIDNSKNYNFSTVAFAANATKYMKPSTAFEPIPSRNRRYVERIKSYCESNGAKLILVSTPSTVNWNSKRHNSIARLSKEIDVEYIDMNMMQKEIPIDWKTDTRDKGDHLNHFGAMKATAYLGKYLEDSGIFDDHRKDKTYSNWNEALKSFNEILIPLAKKAS